MFDETHATRVFFANAPENRLDDLSRKPFVSGSAKARILAENLARMRDRAAVLLRQLLWLFIHLGLTMDCQRCREGPRSDVLPGLSCAGGLSNSDGLSCTKGNSAPSRVSMSPSQHSVSGPCFAALSSAAIKASRIRASISASRQCRSLANCSTSCAMAGSRGPYSAQSRMDPASGCC